MGEKSMIGGRRRGRGNRDDMSAAKERRSFSDMSRLGRGPGEHVKFGALL